MKLFHKLLFPAVVSIFCAVFLGVAQAQGGEVVAKAYSVKGKAESRLNPNAGWKALGRGTKLYDGNEIRVGAGGRVGLKFVSGKLVRLREKTSLKIEAGAGEDSAGRVNLVSGVMHLFSRQEGDSPGVDTRDVSAAIRGTEVVFEKNADGTRVTVLEGQVSLKNSAGSLTLGGGESARAEKDKAPKRFILAEPEDAVQWTMYYPPIFSEEDLARYFNSSTPRVASYWKEISQRNRTLPSLPGKGLTPLEQEQLMFAHSIIFARNGQYQEAIKTLDGIKQLALAKEYKAQYYLAYGDVKSARDILKSIPGLSSVGHAAVAIIEIVNNNVLKAKDAAYEATSGARPSLGAYLARSYVHQAMQEFDEAQKWVEKVLEREPDNATALARLAEFKLGRGDIAQALALLNKPGTMKGVYDYTVQGFAELTAGNTEAAKSAFRRAIAIDSELGAPHLGMGLAIINEGDLAEGRTYIEKAVHLEPARGMYRSYLGKTLFEQELEEKANIEYSRAIELDSTDPTPYLYRAFNRLSRNRLVPALRDIERAIERNENRAVYRAKNLLDEDSSTQSTSLAEVYQQLGFSRVGQLEAMHSINKDYTNFGAHRLLGQSYDGDFYSETQFTAGTIADILAPLSLNVFQGLSGYSSSASLNEYSALFDRDQHRTGIQGIWQSDNDEFTGNIFQTGRMGDFGYFGGYRSAYQRGSKSNGDFGRLHRFDLAGQYQPSYAHRLLGTFAFTRSEDETPEIGDDFEDVEVSIASRHEISEGFEAILRFEYLRRRQESFDRASFRDIEQTFIVDNVLQPFEQSIATVDSRYDIDFDTYSLAAQVIRDYGWFTWIAGFDASQSDIEAADDAFVSNDPLGIYQGTTARADSMSTSDVLSHVSYLYTTTEVTSWLNMNLGFSYAEVELPAFDVLAPFVSGSRTTDLWAPKIGFTARPVENLTLRTAYFKNLGVSNLSSVVAIEPTLVGSFSQRFGDLPGAETENIGVGVDYKIPGKRYFGIEYIYRDITRDFNEYTTQVQYDFDNLREQLAFPGTNVGEAEEEHIIRAYSYHVVSDVASVAADFAHWDLEDVALDTRNELDKFSLSVNYFSPNRWFSFFKPVWRSQSLLNRVGFEDGNESFWTMDFGVGYRIPKRHGSLRFVIRNITDEEFQYEDRGREAPVYSGLNGAVELNFNF